MTATKIILLSFVITAGLIKGAPAVAEPVPGDVNVSIVNTADLDLSNDSGQRELDRRIVRAAREVCGEASNVDLEGGNAVRQCREETIALAASQREQLLAAARSGSPIVVASAR